MSLLHVFVTSFISLLENEKLGGVYFLHEWLPQAISTLNCFFLKQYLSY